jgi:hypothetical protein
MNTDIRASKRADVRRVGDTPWNVGVLLCCFFIMCLAACSSDGDSKPLDADAGPSQTVKPLELVTLDGSASTGPDGFTYSWAYSGEIAESEIDFQNTTTANPTFVPPEAAVYTFTLTTQSGSQVSTDQVTVQATGGIELSGTLTEDLELINIEPNASVPDYVVTSDLIVPDGITVSVAEENVLVYFEADAGMHVTGGGTLTNYNATLEQGLEVTFSGPAAGWKGIWIESGTIELEGALIEFGGKVAFSGVSEAAAVILSGGAPVLEHFEENEFAGSHSYDVLVEGDVTGPGRFASNQMSYIHPLKAPVQFMEFWNSEVANPDPKDVEYSIIIPSGADSKDVISGSHVANNYIFPRGNTYLIDGDFWSGSRVNFVGGSIIYMKADSAILAEDGFSASGTETYPISVSGLDGAQWRGIAISSDSTGTLTISSATIEDAGYGIIDLGGFTAEAAASIYEANKGGSVRDSHIKDGGGHGFYLEPQGEETYVFIKDSLFENLAEAAIRINPESVGYAFASVDVRIVNEFVLDAGVPAVLIQGDGTPTDRWPDLGDGNFYLIDADISSLRWNIAWRLNAGAHLKFKPGRAYVWNPPAASAAYKITFAGEADHPVILEGESDVAGSWGGVYLGGLDGWFDITHTIIRNGGEFIIDDATERANVIANYKGFNGVQLNFTNCTISDSAGWGVVQEAGSFDYNFEGNGNTYSNNASGDVLKKAAP